MIRSTENVAITKRVVDRAHAKGISVEAELGMLRRRRGGYQGRGRQCLPDRSAEAESFVKATGCDSLACAIGTSHGAFKFKGKQSLHFDVLEKIKARLPNSPWSCTAVRACRRRKWTALTLPAAR